MPVTIDQDTAKTINRINKLIHTYRTALTTGVKNASGGYPVKPETLETPKPQTIDLEYGKDETTKLPHKLKVLHVAGNVYGFIYKADTAEEKITYMGNLEQDLTKDVGTHDRIAAYGFLARKFACMARILTERLGGPQSPNLTGLIKNLDHQRKRSADINELYNLLLTANNPQASINNYSAGLSEAQLNTLNKVLPQHLEPRDENNFKVYSTVNRAYSNQGGSTYNLDMSLYMITDRLGSLFENKTLGENEIKNMLDSFLLVCSEGAKNYLIQQQLVSNLIEGNNHGAFVSAMVTAGKNCGNGAINYAEQLGELTNIMGTFGGKQHIIDIINYGKNPQERLGPAKARLVDDPIKTAVEVAINKERLTEAVNHANNDPSDTPKSNLLRALSRMRNQNNPFNAGDLKQFNEILTENRERIAAESEADETSLQRINHAITRSFYDNTWNTNSKYHQDCQWLLQDGILDLNADNPVFQNIPENSALDSLISWKEALNPEIRLRAAADDPEKYNPENNDDDHDPSASTAVLSDIFTNEELGGGHNFDSDNDPTVLTGLPTNNGPEGPSPSNSQPLDKGNYDAKAPLTMDANIIEILEIEPNPEVPKSSMKNDDPEDSGVKPNQNDQNDLLDTIDKNDDPDDSEVKPNQNDQNDLLDTVDKKAAYLNEIGVTEDPECLALIDEIVKNAEKALTVEVELENPSTYTPAFNPRGP